MAYTHTTMAYNQPGADNRLGLFEVEECHPLMDQFLTKVQTYQMEFDPDNPTGRLPGCFAKELGGVISEYVVLQDPNQNEFEVHVVKKFNELFFDDGWSVLGKVYNICFGAWVYFTYVSPQLLNIRLATRWGAEIEYPNDKPPIKHLLTRGGVNSPSVFPTPSNAAARSTSLIRSFTKKLTFCDIHSGTLVLPWYGFGESAFAFVFSDLILVDASGHQFLCVLKFDVDAKDKLCCKVSGGWVDLCRMHDVHKGDKAIFTVNQRCATNVMHVSIYHKTKHGRL